MRNAPSVMFPVGRCGFYAGLLVLLAVLGAWVMGAWWWTTTDLRAAWMVPAGAMLWLAWVAFAVWSWRRSPTGQLRWDALSAGEESAGGWLWYSASCAEGAPLQRVEVMLDLQNLALLRLHNADALARWVWVERARDPVRWNDLRRALASTRA
jgi:toxin CptA